MATWRYVLIWMALLFAIVGWIISFILAVTGQLSARQIVRQGLVASAVAVELLNEGVVLVVGEIHGLSLECVRGR